MDYRFIHVSGNAGGVAIPWVSPQELPLSMRMASTPYLYNKNVKLSTFQEKISLFSTLCKLRLETFDNIK